MRRILVVIAVSIGLIGPAAAEQRAAPVDHVAAIKRALEWIEANTDYKNIPPPRSYAVLDADGMRVQSTNLLRGTSSAGAIYLCSSQTVFLRDTFDPTQVWDMSILVHEITHHAQCVTHGAIRDFCRAEGEAYDMQFRYLEQKATKNRERLPETRKRADEFVARHCRR